MTGNFNMKEWQERRRRLFQERAELDLDIKENALEGKAFAVNVPAFDKWLKAEISDEHVKTPKRVAKLISQTVDQVVYGESLGHDLGMLQNNAKQSDVKVENVSNPASTNARAGEAGGTGTVPRTASPNESQPGGETRAPRAASGGRPFAGTGSDEDRQPNFPEGRSGTAREASSAGSGDDAAALSGVQPAAPRNPNPSGLSVQPEGGTGGFTGPQTSPVSPDPIDDEPDLPARMNRANWTDGNPPA